MSSEPPDPASGQKTVIMNLSENKSPTMWIPSKQQKPYQCGLCCVMFDINIELVYHIKKHSLTKPYQCGYCQVSFDSNVELTLHHGKAHVRALFVIKPEPPKAGVVSPSDGQGGGVLSPPATQSTSASSERNSTRTEDLIPKNVSADTNSSIVSFGRIGDSDSTSDYDIGPSYKEIKSETLEMPDLNQYEEEDLDVHFEHASGISRGQNPDLKHQTSDLKLVTEDNLKKHQCAECKQRFKFKYHLNQHWCEPRKCSMCDIMLSSKVTYKTHMMHKHATETDSVLESHSTEESLQCAECKQCFKYKFALNQHWCKPKKCSVCDIMLTSKLTYKKHMVRKHATETETAKKMHKCADCKKSFLYKYDLNQHWCKPRKCSVCDKMLTSKVTRKYHMMRIHGTKIEPAKKKKRSSSTSEESHQCDECKRCFKHKWVMNQHWCKPRKCLFCDIMLTSKLTYKNHMTHKHARETDSVNTTHRCPECQKSYKYKYDLSQHWCKPRKCSLCDKMLTSKVTYKYHMMRMHSTKKDPVKKQPGTAKPVKRKPRSSTAKPAKKKPSSDEPSHQCAECGKCFNCKYDLNRHWCKPRKCAVCDMMLTSSKTYNEHMKRMHSTAHEKPFQCGNCEKAFAFKQDLAQHSRVHAEIKPYICEFCGKSYGTSDGLKYHRNSHLNNTPYKCKLCPREFSSRPSQDLHERRHIGDKRYSCDQCDKKFYDSGSLQRHALTHTDLRSYVCEVCSKTYRSPSALGHHLKHSHHL